MQHNQIHDTENTRWSGEALSAARKRPHLQLAEEAKVWVYVGLLCPGVVVCFSKRWLRSCTMNI